MTRAEARQVAGEVLRMVEEEGYFLDRAITISEYASIIGKSVKTVYNQPERYPRLSFKPLLFSEHAALMMAQKLSSAI